jgi:predicted PurR-regulated permease PerM
MNSETGTTPHESLRFTVRTLPLLVVTGLAVYLCSRLAAPFVAPITWALALAVVFVPLQRALERRWNRPNLSAATSVLLIGLIVIGATWFVGQRLYVEVARGAELFETKVEAGEWRHTLAAHPYWLRLVERVESQIDLPGTMRTFVAWLGAGAGRLLTGSVMQLAGAGITFYLLFYFLRDRGAVLDAVRWLSPLESGENERLFARMRDTIYATLYGEFVVGIVQGVLGGLMFWWLGLPSPFLWGAVMTLLSFLPLFGAAIVWVPTALFLAGEGSWGKAMILTTWGFLIVSTIDNILRPILVGNRLKLHPILVFLAVFGGVIFLGPAGLVLGPLAVTLTIGLLEIERVRYAAKPPRAHHRGASANAKADPAARTRDGAATAPHPVSAGRVKRHRAREASGAT